MASDARDHSFEHIYACYSSAVLAYCIRRVGRTLAADACSETFLVAWRRLDELPTEPKTLPYLYGVAARVLANQRRSLLRRRRLDWKLESLGVAPIPDPAAIVVRQSQDAEVASAVRRLGPKDREIVMLYAWEDLPRETIAEMMGLTRAAVDQRIHRSYKRLATALRHSMTNTEAAAPLVTEEGTGR
jgi:RNA polymerase sigma-70 factor, ECF subfamily